MCRRARKKKSTPKGIRTAHKRLASLTSPPYQCFSSEFNKKLGVENTHLPAALGMNCYKKMFIEHTSSNGRERIKGLNLNNNRSFEDNYCDFIATKEKFRENKKMFAEFLKKKEKVEKIKLLDQMDKIFKVISEYLIENPSRFGNFDVKKVII